MSRSQCMGHVALVGGLKWHPTPVGGDVVVDILIIENVTGQSASSLLVVGAELTTDATRSHRRTRGRLTKTHIYACAEITYT